MKTGRRKSIMAIRNNKELSLFEKIVSQCKHKIWIVSPLGKEYDLRNPMERYMGIFGLLKSDGAEEPELFASGYDDEMRFFDFFAVQRSAAYCS